MSKPTIHVTKATGVTVEDGGTAKIGGVEVEIRLEKKGLKWWGWALIAIAVLAILILGFTLHSLLNWNIGF